MPSMTNGRSSGAFPDVSFTESPVVEMLTALQTLLDPVKEREWSEHVRETLGNRFIDRLRDVYRSFHGGNDFIEFVMDDEASLTMDVSTFIDWVASLPPRRFLFLVLGRVYREDELPSDPTAASVQAFIERNRRRAGDQHVGADFLWCDDVVGTQERLVSLWRAFSETLFGELFASRRQERTEAIRVMEAFLAVHGPWALFRRLCGMDDLPRRLPPDVPYRDIVYVPVSMFSGASHLFYGYGHLMALFDATETDERRQREEEQRERLVRTFRALSDPGRLRILQIIAGNDFKFNGRRIAAWMDLSTSVVSRHLQQLKAAELIEDHSPDNRNTVYRLRLESVQELSDTLVSFLKKV